MTEKKQFHLKIKWKNREKTEAHEIVLYDGGQPLCELISVDDARLVRDILNEQDERIETLKEDVEIILDYVLNKGKFAMSVKEQKAHNRLRGFVRGDVDD